MSAVQIRFTVDAETHAALAEWSEDEGRSARQQAAVLLRKLATLKRDAPAELARLGLADKLLNPESN